MKANRATADMRAGGWGRSKGGRGGRRSARRGFRGEPDAEDPPPPPAVVVGTPPSGSARPAHDPVPHRVRHWRHRLRRELGGSRNWSGAATPVRARSSAATRSGSPSTRSRPSAATWVMPTRSRKGVEGADVVVHVAGLTRARDQETLDRANVDGTVRLLDAVADAGGVARTLVTSSLEAMGPNTVRPDGMPVPAVESDPSRPISMYGRSKARMEAAIAERFSNLPGHGRPPRRPSTARARRTSTR